MTFRRFPDSPVVAWELAIVDRPRLLILLARRRRGYWRWGLHNEARTWGTGWRLVALGIGPLRLVVRWR